MKARRLLTALVIALAVSGLFTFWLSRRVAKGARVTAPLKQRYVAASEPLEAGEFLKPAKPAIGRLAGVLAAYRRVHQDR